MAEKLSSAKAKGAAIAAHDQPREPAVDQRQQGDNKAGADPETQPQHDEEPQPQSSPGKA
ncbi:MAG: hypothetical protein EOP61_18250 [Sphingomonadales bacterium]|nr:MAG: hypothetical protein EOP61_18250 [Sphingomonadales bacterium]